MLDSALGMYASVAISKGWTPDVRVIAERGPMWKISILELSKEDKRVRDWLFDLSTSNLYLNVIVSSAALVVPILFNHNLIPPLFRKRSKESSDNGAESSVEEQFVQSA